MSKLFWTQKQDIGPSARHSFGMKFDGARSRVVMFGGGQASGLAGDTWEWNGEFRTQTADIGPCARVGSALAYDGNRQRIVLFGGHAGTESLGDTWEWDGAEWTAYFRSTTRTTNESGIIVGR
jgi:hypothetical protein